MFPYLPPAIQYSSSSLHIRFLFPPLTSTLCTFPPPYSSVCLPPIFLWFIYIPSPFHIHPVSPLFTTSRLPLDLCTILLRDLVYQPVPHLLFPRFLCLFHIPLLSLTSIFSHDRNTAFLHHLVPPPVCTPHISRFFEVTHPFNIYHVSYIFSTFSLLPFTLALHVCLSSLPFSLVSLKLSTLPYLTGFAYIYHPFLFLSLSNLCFLSPPFSSVCHSSYSSSVSGLNVLTHDRSFSCHACVSPTWSNVDS